MDGLFFPRLRLFFFFKCNEAILLQIPILLQPLSDGVSCMNKVDWKGGVAFKARILWLMWGDVNYLFNFSSKLCEPIVRDDHEQEDNLDDRSSGPGVTAGGVWDEIKKTSKLLLKSSLVFSVMYRGRGHESGVENSERIRVVIISEMVVSSPFSDT